MCLIDLSDAIFLCEIGCFQSLIHMHVPSSCAPARTLAFREFSLTNKHQTNHPDHQNHFSFESATKPEKNSEKLSIIVILKVFVHAQELMPAMPIGVKVPLLWVKKAHILVFGVPNNKLTCMQSQKTLSLCYNMHLILPYLLNDSQTIRSTIHFSKSLLR